MSQSNAQLIAPVGIFTASGLNATGVITASSFVGDGSQLQGVGVGTTGSINSLGIVTASAFYGNGANLTGITLIGPTDNYTTSGIITAGSFYGDGIGITNIGGPLNPIIYSPGIGATNISNDTNIVITFNKPIAAAAATTGISTITLRSGSASGTILESYDIANVAAGSSVSISGAVLTINPTDSVISAGTTFYVVIPAGTLQDTIDTSDNTGITTYSFKTADQYFQLWSWGYNGNGQLGQNTTITHSSPRQIPGTQWSFLSTARRRNISAIKSDGTFWSWGYGENYGELGLNDRTPRSSPVQIPGTQWASASNGDFFSLAKKTDGTLWAWGYNGQGALGQNTAGTTHYSSPVQIPGTQWNTFVSGNYNNIATKTDGTLWTWGGFRASGRGQLGLNDNVHRSSPTQIPGTQWNTISSCYSHMLATKTDGTLWAWGNNGSGQLGQNSVVHRSSPTQIPGTQWNKISVGALDYTVATKTDGTLWSWGYNAFGNLGQNNRTYYSSPVQVPGIQWNALTTGNPGGGQTLATKTDNTLWGWGEFPGLAQNNNIPRSSPVQIPGTQWTSISAAYRSGYAIKTVT